LKAMKSFFAYVWQRRWCRSLLWIALIVGLACVHPFVRQTLFGPKIDGIPWCVWENQVRLMVHGEAPKPWFYALLEKIGLIQQERGAIDLNSKAALPLYLHLAGDNDPRVRFLALHQLTRDRNLRDAESEILPIMERLLKDDDPRCRLGAVYCIWRKTKDPELRHIVLPLVYHNDRDIRDEATVVLGEMAVPETFELMAKLSEDPEKRIRQIAMPMMPKFGKRAIPILRKGLQDPDLVVRFAVIDHVGSLGKDAAELIPDLLAFENDDSGMPPIRRRVADLLPLIDPERFPASAKAD
jgi:hypothetical protein